jgi:hypothetical protein
VCEDKRPTNPTGQLSGTKMKNKRSVSISFYVQNKNKKKTFRIGMEFFLLFGENIDREEATLANNAHLSIDLSNRISSGYICQVHEPAKKET